MSRYLTGHWGHIFNDREGERLCRIVVDEDNNHSLVALQVRGASGWSEATPAEWTDVEQDLKDNDDLLRGEDSGLESEDDVPAWAAPTLRVPAPEVGMATPGPA